MIHPTRRTFLKTTAAMIKREARKGWRPGVVV